MAGSVQSCVIQVNNIQRMIDINASNLEGLRTQCTATSDLIQQEIKDQEAKLVKLFSRMLMARQKIEAECTNELDYHQYPRLEQWLHVVGVGHGGIKVIIEKYGSFGSLLAEEEDNIRGVLQYSNTGLQDARKLIAALNNLRDVTAQRRSGSKSTSSIPLNSTSSSSDSAVLVNGESPAVINGVSSMNKAKTGPPPPLANIKRSKSDELATKPRLDAMCLSPGGSLGKYAGRRLRVDLPYSESLERLVSERNNNRHSSSSNNSSSPKTPTRVNLTEKHKFTTKQMMIPTACYLCKKQVFRGVKCEECGMRFHKKCSKKSLSGCELFREVNKLTLRNTRQYRSLPHRSNKFKGERTKSEPTALANQIDTPRTELRTHTSHGELFHNGTMIHSGTYTRGARKETPPQFAWDPLVMSGVLADAVTTHSSTSTPQHSPPLTTSHHVPASAPPQELHDRQGTTARSVRRRKGLAHFFFPDDDNEDDDDREDTDETIGRKNSVLSSESSLTVNSNDSTISGDDAPNIESLESQISDYDSLTRTWSSKRWERESHLSEWTIPFNEIELQVKIGVGRIGEVFRGNWHGQVAVKVIDIQQPTVTQLQAFKIQVQTFRKTRHENLVLFMGACMEPPKLAIITSLCKGHPLFNRIHEFNETLPLEKLMVILKQVAQGMSYLHSRGIIHADLKSKNIFFENNTKVVITDFGHLRLAAGLSVGNKRPGRVLIPCGWLYYLAPEVISILSPYRALNKRMFTKESDVYAFGTLCYELLAGAWPFSDFPLETLIYQVGKGARQPLNKLDVVREMKDAINIFWANQPNRRPNFKNISKLLEKIPIAKGRLYRSQSQSVTRALEASF